MDIEQSNYIRAYHLIIKYGKEAIQTFFHKTIPQHELGGLLSIKRDIILRHLNKKEAEKLYPNDGSSINSGEFDISLMVTILRYSGLISGVQHTTWDKEPTYITTDVEAVATIKHYRNALAHTRDFRLSTSMCNGVFMKTLDAILCLGGNALYEAAKTIREASLDSTELSKNAEIFSVITSSDYRLKGLEVDVAQIKKAIDTKQSILDASLKILQNSRIVRCFVPTAAYADGLELLNEKSVLIFLGRAGDGKSTNAVKILSDKIGDEDCEVMKLYPEELSRWKSLVNSEKTKYLFLDDILGKHNANEEIFRTTEVIQFFEDVMSLIERQTGSVKVIMCIRKSIYLECAQYTRSYEIFNEKYCIDLTSEEYILTTEEKVSIIEKHLDASEGIPITITDNLADENIFTDAILGTCPVLIARWTLHKIATESTDYEGYPLSCRHFASERKLLRLGRTYFSYPRRYLIDNLNQMRDVIPSMSTDVFMEQVKYCTLVYLMLHGNTLDCDRIELESFQDIVESLGFERNLKDVKTSHIANAARLMIRKYLYVDRNGIFRFEHDTIAEAVIFSYGDVCQKAILDRLDYKVLLEVVRTEAYQSARDEVCLRIRSKYNENLADRFLVEIRKNNGLTVSGHSAMDDKNFIAVFMKKLAEARAEKEFVSENGENVNETLFTGACYFRRLTFAEHLLYNVGIPLPLSLFATMYSCHSGYTDQVESFFKYFSKAGSHLEELQGIPHLKELQGILHLKGLFAACETGHEDTVELILKVLEKPNPEDFVEAFHTACSQGKLEIAKLLKSRMQMQQEQSCLTQEHAGKALVSAASKGCVEIVDWLMTDNSDIPEEYIVKSFKRACMFQYGEVTKVICDRMSFNTTLCDNLKSLYNLSLFHRYKRMHHNYL